MFHQSLVIYRIIFFPRLSRIRAITNSSSVGMTNTLTFESSVVMSRARALLVELLIKFDPQVTEVLTELCPQGWGVFPIPAVKTKASMPPIAAI